MQHDVERIIPLIQPQDRGHSTRCWIWQLAPDSAGYGKLKVRREWKKAHRFVYETVVGDIPDGLVLDHLCRNPICVNPDHMEPVTQAENMHRSGPAQKAHCANGHPYDEQNTYTRPTGQRDCPACGRERTRRYLEGKAA